jgi:hypothetical protein
MGSFFLLDDPYAAALLRYFGRVCMKASTD